MKNKKFFWNESRNKNEQKLSNIIPKSTEKRNDFFLVFYNLRYNSNKNKNKKITIECKL